MIIRITTYMLMSIKEGYPQVKILKKVSKMDPT